MAGNRTLKGMTIPEENLCQLERAGFFVQICLMSTLRQTNDSHIVIKGGLKRYLMGKYYGSVTFLSQM